VVWGTKTSDAENELNSVRRVTRLDSLFPIRIFSQVKLSQECYRLVQRLRLNVPIERLSCFQPDLRIRHWFIFLSENVICLGGDRELKIARIASLADLVECRSDSLIIASTTQCCRQLLPIGGRSFGFAQDFRRAAQ